MPAVHSRASDRPQEQRDKQYGLPSRLTRYSPRVRIEQQRSRGPPDPVRNEPADVRTKGPRMSQYNGIAQRARSMGRCPRMMSPPPGRGAPDQQNRRQSRAWGRTPGHGRSACMPTSWPPRSTTWADSSRCERWRHTRFTRVARVLYEPKTVPEQFRGSPLACFMWRRRNRERTSGASQNLSEDKENVFDPASLPSLQTGNQMHGFAVLKIRFPNSDRNSNCIDPSHRFAKTSQWRQR